MIFSNKRKLCLSGWLQKNNRNEYNTPLKLQKFLLLYESFSKVSGEAPDFGHLRGYKRGPVFSNVWGDYTKEREAFDKVSNEAYASGVIEMDEVRAKKSAFIVSVLSESELSELTHTMNLWKAKEKRIMAGEYQVDLDENDFNENDSEIISMLDRMYPIQLIENSKVIEIDNHYFIFKKNDMQKLTEQHFDTLSGLSENGELFNPIYVDIDEEGRLVID